MNKQREAVLAVAKRLATQAITHAAGIPGNVSGKQRRDVAVEYLEDRASQFMETKDHLLPAVGEYMDLPVVDDMQRRAVHLVLSAFVERIWTEGEVLKVLKGTGAQS